MAVDVDLIMRHEDGDLDAMEELTLFGELIASGMAWSLQGSYGRHAVALIEAGYLTREGMITEAGYNAALD